MAASEHAGAWLLVVLAVSPHRVVRRNFAAPREALQSAGIILVLATMSMTKSSRRVSVSLRMQPKRSRTAAMSFYQYSHWLITHDRVTNNPGDRTDGIDKSYTINTTLITLTSGTDFARFRLIPKWFDAP